MEFKTFLKFALMLTLVPAPAVARVEEPFFSYRLTQEFEQPRGIFWRPVFSMILPGFDQWAEGQHRSAAVYSGYALTGAVVARTTRSHGFTDSPTKSYDDANRKILWGTQAYMAAGFVSAFHSFRKAAETQKAQGKYLFLKHEETAGDLMLAPLNFKHLTKPAVFIPLGLLAGLITVARAGDVLQWQGSDMLFGSAVSFNAGVGEEAVFRGYLMPVLRQSWNSDLWSNVATATVFAGAHYPANRIPWQQFLLGFYFGMRVQKNEWQLGEAVFLHTWWDIVIITSQLAYNRGREFHLPLLRAEF